MAIYEFPSEPDDSKKKEEVHSPEFIYVDEPHQSGGFTEESHYFQAFNNLSDVKIPFFMRFVAFFLSLFFAFIAVLFTAVAFIWLFLAVLFGYRNQRINEKSQQLWNQTKRTYVTAFSFFIGIFSPSLGLGLFLMYHLLRGEEVSDKIISRLKKGF